MLKRTTKEVAEYFKQHGCELLGKYLGCMEPMEYRCSCGKYSEISWNNFTKGKRCGHCVKHGQKKKRSLEEVKAIFKERGCEFLDEEFKGIHYKHKYRCKCGKKGEVTFAGIYYMNQHCYDCGLKKLRGENHPQWITDRKQKRLNDLFRKKCYKALSSTLKATGKEKVGHTSDMLGYGPKELQEHIIEHPNWNKVKDENWHLDHIFPINAFLEHGIKDIKIINTLDNLEPLEGKENISKSSSYDKQKFLEWLESLKID